MSVGHNGINDMRAEVAAALRAFFKGKCANCGTGILRRGGEVINRKTDEYEVDEIWDAIRAGCSHANDRQIANDHFIPRRLWPMIVNKAPGYEHCAKHSVARCKRSMNCPANRVVLCRACNDDKSDHMGARRALGAEFANSMIAQAEDRLAYVEAHRAEYVDATRPQRLAYKRPHLIAMLRKDFGYPPCVDCLAAKRASK
jgi:hypothetical protein